jgi:8-oxo-dGTP diphosphatase
MATLRVVGAAIVQQQRCLVAQRGEGMSLAGKWEFPGGKVEPGESPIAALARELAEELGLQVAIAQLLATGTATVGARVITLDVYAATITAGTIALREHAQVAWATADELDHFDWAEADIPCIQHVQNWLRESQHCPQ